MPQPSRDPSELPDIGPLLAELNRLIAESKGTPREISTVSIAGVIGYSQPHVSKVLSGDRSLRGMPEETIRALLACFPYEPLVIEGMMEAYQLGEPDRVAPKGKVPVMHEGSISRPHGRKPAEIDARYVVDYDVNLLRVREVAASDFATPAARDRAPIGTELLIHTTASPIADSLVIVEVPKFQALVVWPIPESEYAVPYESNPKGKPLFLPRDARIVGVVIRTSRPHPYRID